VLIRLGSRSKTASFVWLLMLHRSQSHPASSEPLGSDQVPTLHEYDHERPEEPIDLSPG